jgi:tetratricopeptide (TPR) repeat protein
VIRLILGRKSTDSLPLVAYRSWWRTMLAYLIMWAPGLALGGWIIFGLGWRPLGDGWLITLAAIAFLCSILVRLVVGTVASRVLCHLETAHRLLAQQNYEEALGVLQEHLAFVEKYPFLDRWRTVLFLYDNKHNLKEMAWLNVAFAGMRCGDLKKAQAAYEQCLAINPRNEMAVDNLNFIAAFTGEPRRSGGGGLTFCQAIDLGQNRRQANITFVAVLIALFGFVPVVGSLMMLLRQSIVAWLAPDAPWLLGIFVSVLLLYFLIDVLVKIYGWTATHMVLFDLYRADSLTRAGRCQEAIKALEIVRAFFVEHPWVDSLRWLLLLSATTYSYHEWVSISLADVYLDMGDADRYIHFNQQCLTQNPKNAFARVRLEACNTILAGLNRPPIPIPALE